MAYEPATSTSITITGYVPTPPTYRTQIILNQTGGEFIVGEIFELSGILQYAEPTFEGGVWHYPATPTWKPLANKTIHLYENGVEIAQVTTNSSGAFAFQFEVKEGSYTYYVEYKGD